MMILDGFTSNQLYEMSNFGHRTTGLPSNIDIWVRTETSKLQHSNYRIKVEKNKEYAAIFSVEEYPKMIIQSHKNKLTGDELNEIVDFIATHFDLIIDHIDGKIDSGDLAYEIRNARGVES